MLEEDELPEPNPIKYVVSGLQQRLNSFVRGSLHIIGLLVTIASLHPTILLSLKYNNPNLTVCVS
jgi:hypothetical protein